jgi:hypothetical protein
MLDLAKTNIAEAAEAGAEFELLIPKSNTPTGAFIKVRGPESKTVRDYARKTYAEMQARDSVARKRGKEPETITIEEAETMAINSAVVRVISWRGITDNGKEVEFTAEAAREIFRKHPWIRDQVMEESDSILYFQP